MNQYLNHLLYFCRKTAEIKTELGGHVMTAVATLGRNDDGFCLTDIDESSIIYKLIPDSDLVLGLDVGDRVRIYYRELGKKVHDFIPPNFSEKQPLPGMINPRLVIKRIEKVH